MSLSYFYDLGLEPEFDPSDGLPHQKIDRAHVPFLHRFSPLPEELFHELDHLVVLFQRAGSGLKNQLLKLGFLDLPAGDFIEDALNAVLGDDREIALRVSDGGIDLCDGGLVVDLFVVDCHLSFSLFGDLV